MRVRDLRSVVDESADEVWGGGPVNSAVASNRVLHVCAVGLNRAASHLGCLLQPKEVARAA